MTSPVSTTTVEDVSPSQPMVRRSRKRWSLAGGLVLIVALAFSTAACTPETVAKAAIAKHWGHNAACAEKIVKRESGFQADAVNSSSGTIGLFQIHPTHTTWIRRTYGYEFSELKDPNKNAEVAKGLSSEAYNYYGDGWQPWRVGGKVIRGGGCPA